MDRVVGVRAVLMVGEIRVTRMEVEDPMEATQEAIRMVAENPTEEIREAVHTEVEIPMEDLVGEYYKYR